MMPKLCAPPPFASKRAFYIAYVAFKVRQSLLRTALHFELLDLKVHFLASEKCTIFHLKLNISVIMYATQGNVYIF